MKPEKEQHISTRNELQSSDAAPEGAGCTPADISQKTVSSNSQTTIESSTCGHVASVTLVKLSSVDSQVLQGIFYEGKFETSLVCDKKFQAK